MKIRDLRKVLKNVRGDADIDFGNYSVYKPRLFKDKLNIFYNDLSIINKDETYTNDKIKKVIIWVVE